MVMAVGRRMMALVLCGLLACGVGPLASGHGDGHGLDVGPFLQMATPESIWVVWESAEGVGVSVDYGLPGNLGTTVQPTVSIVTGQGTEIHQTELTGLTPETVYEYRVNVGAETGHALRFRTPAEQEDEEPFRFVAYSDTQGGPISDKHTEIINEGVLAFVGEEFRSPVYQAIDFAIQPGDLVSTGTRYEQWKEQFFDEQQNLIQHIPLYPVPGNHEQDAQWFFDYFKLPENGTAGFEEHWWYKDHGNVRLIGLDSNGPYRIDTQLQWLESVLQDAESDDAIDFVFAQLHHPHLSGIWTPGNTAFTDDVVRKLEGCSSRSGKPSVHVLGATVRDERG